MPSPFNSVLIAKCTNDVSYLSSTVARAQPQGLWTCQRWIWIEHPSNGTRHWIIKGHQVSSFAFPLYFPLLLSFSSSFGHLIPSLFRPSSSWSLHHPTSLMMSYLLPTELTWKLSSALTLLVQALFPTYDTAVSILYLFEQSIFLSHFSHFPTHTYILTFRHYLILLCLTQYQHKKIHYFNTIIQDQSPSYLPGSRKFFRMREIFFVFFLSDFFI